MMKKLLLAVLIFGFGIGLIPHAALGQPNCTDANHSYTACLQQYPNDLSKCACCVVASPGGELASVCASQLANLSHCTKPIGVLIYQTSTTLTNPGGGNPIIFSPFDACGNSCCNVGILAKHPPDSEMNHVIISDVTVQNWADGILFWRVNNPGEIWNSTITGNGHGIYFFNTGKGVIASNTITGSSQSGIYLDNNVTHGSKVATIDTTIYSNYFNNTNNVNFWDSQHNYWNLSRPIGGNYWGQPDSQGFSDKCTCDSGGVFCNKSYNLTPPDPTKNVDWLPLCKPKSYITIKVSGSAFLEEIGYGLHENTTGIDMDVETNAKHWSVGVRDESLEGKLYPGHMVAYDPISQTWDNSYYLHDPIQVNSDDLAFKDLSDSLTEIQSGTCLSWPNCLSTYDIGVRQNVTYSDVGLPPGHIYRVVITFIGIALP